MRLGVYRAERTGRIEPLCNTLWTATVLYARDSAMRGGERVRLPDFAKA